MVIDFNRLGTTPSTSSGARSSVAVDAETTRSDTASETTTAAAVAASSSESVELSPAAMQLQQANKAIQAQPQVDQEKVSRLKEAIANGSYQIDSNRVASRMMNYEATL
jgi:negative regulator of flagellin synthesis FlgM